MGRPTDPNFWQQSPPPQTGDMNNERTLNQRFMRELPGALPPQDVIIHDGAISGFESAALIVDTEGEAAADELNVINIVLSANENLHPGMIITLRAKDQARTVTVKNSAAANGINTAGGHDVVLSTEWDLVLRLVAGRWYEIQTRGDVRASDAQTDASTALARTNPATTTARGIGKVATLADMDPGVTVENGPAFLAANSEAIAVTPTPHAVPQAGADGEINPAWIPFFNSIEEIASSRTYTAIKTGWYYVIVQAAGGAGADSDKQAANASYSGGGGGGGGCSHGFIWLEAGQTVPVTIGAGGLYATTLGSGTIGGDGGNSSFGSISATGGVGGNGALGGVGGTGNLSDGAPGTGGQYINVAADRWLPGGTGGTSHLGQGSRAPSLNSSNTRIAGTAPTKGGGGSGSSAFGVSWDSAAQKGSAGADGIIILMYNA